MTLRPSVYIQLFNIIKHTYNTYYTKQNNINQEFTYPDL